MKFSSPIVARLFLAAFAFFLLASSQGCKTTEPDNASARPWNSPKGWEGGLPGGYFDRERR